MKSIKATLVPKLTPEKAESKVFSPLLVVALFVNEEANSRDKRARLGWINVGQGKRLAARAGKRRRSWFSG